MQSQKVRLFFAVLDLLIYIALLVVAIIAIYDHEWAKATCFLVIMYGSIILEQLRKE